jgi:ATP-dependent RNA helicase DeaD
LKIVEPTEIQQAIPLPLANTTDLVALAKTGTGKQLLLDSLLQLIDNFTPRYKRLFWFLQES